MPSQATCVDRVQGKPLIVAHATVINYSEVFPESFSG